MVSLFSLTLLLLLSKAFSSAFVVVDRAFVQVNTDTTLERAFLVQVINSSNSTAAAITTLYLHANASDDSTIVVPPKYIAGIAIGVDHNTPVKLVNANFDARSKWMVVASNQLTIKGIRDVDLKRPRLSGNRATRVFYVAPGSSLTLEDVELIQGCRSVVYKRDVTNNKAATISSGSCIEGPNDTECWDDRVLRPDSEYKARCRCTTTDNTMGASVCTGEDVFCADHFQKCDTTFGCDDESKTAGTGSNRCNNKCSCRPHNNVTSDMTFQECREQCHSVGMFIPSTIEGVLATKATGCHTDHREMWVSNAPGWYTGCYDNGGKYFYLFFIFSKTKNHLSRELTFPLFLWQEVFGLIKLHW